LLLVGAVWSFSFLGVPCTSLDYLTNKQKNSGRLFGSVLTKDATCLSLLLLSSALLVYSLVSTIIVLVKLVLHMVPLFPNNQTKGAGEGRMDGWEPGGDRAE
jgi:hypothetical protein